MQCHQCLEHKVINPVPPIATQNRGEIELILNVTRIAAVAFSFYLRPGLTVTSFTAGFLGGILSEMKGWQLERGDLVFGCLVAYFQTLTGIKPSEIFTAYLVSGTMMNCIYHDEFMSATMSGFIGFRWGLDTVSYCKAQLSPRESRAT